MAVDKAKESLQDPPTKLQESIRKLAKEWPAKDTNFFHVMLTGIKAYVPLKSRHINAKEVRVFTALARKHGLTEKGVYFLIKAESARKDFLLYDLAVKGDLFTNTPPRGLDRLSNVLFGILKQIGKNAHSKDVLKELRRIADARSTKAIIQEVDDENIVYWRNKEGVERTTPLRHIENRMIKLRKQI